LRGRRGERRGKRNSKGIATIIIYIYRVPLSSRLYHLSLYGRMEVVMIMMLDSKQQILPPPPISLSLLPPPPSSLSVVVIPSMRVAIVP